MRLTACSPRRKLRWVRRTPVIRPTIVIRSGNLVHMRRRRAMRNDEYRAEAIRLEPYESLARMIVARRIRYGLTQGQLADRMGTSIPAISRPGERAASAEPRDAGEGCSRVR